MKKKLSKDTKILSDNEVKVVTKAFKGIIGSTILIKAKECGIEIEDTIRFHAVVNRLIESREAKDLTIKEVSLHLKVPQYRIKEIERGILRNIKIEILDKYIVYLGLAEWFRKWLEANPKLKSKLNKQSN